MNHPAAHIGTAADFFAQQHDEDEEHHIVFEQTDIRPYIDRARQDVAHLAAQLDPGAIWQLPSDPMERIATALEAIAGGNRKADEHGRVVNSSQYRELAEQYRALAEQIQALTEELADNESVRYDMADVIERIDEALGKSKAGPALAAKAVIETWRNPQAPSAVDGISDEEKAEIEKHLEPEGWEPPESLTAEQVLRLAAGETGAEVAPMEGRTTVGPPANDAPVEAWREYARSQGFAGPEIDKANRSQIRTALGVVQPVEGGA